MARSTPNSRNTQSYSNSARFCASLRRRRQSCSLGRARQEPPADRVRVSGHVEATDVQLARPGWRTRCSSSASPRATASKPATSSRGSIRQTPSSRSPARRPSASRPRRSCGCCSRARASEDIRQAEAQVAAAPKPTSRAADAELAAAQADVDRFEALLASNSGSRKQRDDAVTRRDVARRARAGRPRPRRRGARKRRPRCVPARGARRSTPRARASPPPTRRSRPGEGHRRRHRHCRPMAGIVTEKLAEVGELLQPRAPVVVVTDLDHAWANVYVDEPIVPRLRLGQPATLFTDAGGPGIAGTVSYISSKAEFTPRNVQTAEDRSKLVYRVKVVGRQRGRHAQDRHAGRSRDSVRAAMTPDLARSRHQALRPDHGRPRPVAVGRAPAKCSA